MANFKPIAELVNKLTYLELKEFAEAISERIVDEEGVEMFDGAPILADAIAAWALYEIEYAEEPDQPEPQDQ